jgi:hypothetical protein
VHDRKIEKSKPPGLTLSNGRKAIRQPDRPEYAFSVVK